VNCTKNAFVGQAPPGTAEGSYSAPPDLLAVIRGVCPMLEGTHNVSSWDQPLMRRGREGWEVGERVRKGKGYLSRGPEFLVTLLFSDNNGHVIQWSSSGRTRATMYHSCRPSTRRRGHRKSLLVSAAARIALRQGNHIISYHIRNL